MAEPPNRAPIEFWESDYNSRVQLPARPSEDFTPERLQMAALEELAPVQAGERVLEAGCAPGRWLIWYAERFGADVTGIEYAPDSAELTRRNVAAAGVDARIVEGDFFDPGIIDERFDLVLSIGFIEHFDDLHTAFSRHVDFLADDGRLAILVPNFKGAIKLLQLWGDPDFLAMHNERAMQPGLYRELAARSGLVVENVRYFDPLDPDMIRLRRHGPGVLTVPMRRLRRWRGSDGWNHRFLSTWLALTFRRPQ